MPINVDRQSRVTFGGTKKIIFISSIKLTVLELGGEKLWLIETHKVLVLDRLELGGGPVFQGQGKYKIDALG